MAIKPYKLVSRESKAKDSAIKLKNTSIGGANFTVMAGPCSVESEEAIESIAEIIKNCGIKIMRGGAFKPRTSPYSFQGLGEEGLKLIRKAADKRGLLVISEIMDAGDIPAFIDLVDIIQVGTRNMYNYSLLKELGKVNKPILLKRGMSATIEEFLLAAEYILKEGNENVILCERGIRTFENYTRNTLDISAVPTIKNLSHLPIVVDPSHAAGRSDIVPALAKAALAVGADGLLIEVHDHPDIALSDGAQSLLPEQLSDLMDDLRKIAPVLGKIIS